MLRITRWCDISNDVVKCPAFLEHPLENTFLVETSALWLIAKTCIFLFFYLWFRATFPRYRYDQIMRLGWKVFIPITIVWLLLVALFVVQKWLWWAP